MLSYHNDPSIKQEILAQLNAHYDADEVIKGIYWEDGKGCAVGCTIHGDNHAEYETKFGIPRILAKLEDSIFERLPNELAKEWPIQFMEAIPVGVDLSNVWKQFVIWLLEDPIYGVINFAKSEEDKDFIQSFINANKRWGANKISRQKWLTLQEKTYDKYCSYADFDSTDRVNIYTIYNIAVAADDHAAYSAYSAYCASTAYDDYVTNSYEKNKYTIAQANKLIELLQQAKGD